MPDGVEVRGTRMKAIVQDRYGSPRDALKLRQIDQPMVADNEALVRVYAAAVNISDVIFARGLPYLLRLGFGLRRPNRRVPGVDIAGKVEAVGKNVQELQPGEELFGWCDPGRGGAFAEYASVVEDHLLLKPAGLTFPQAAALGVSAGTALQGVRDHGRLVRGQKVLINGASGGVGTFAVQIAKSVGAHVTGVCSTRNVEMVRSLGADKVIDYTLEDFTRSGQRYDLVLDNIANHSLRAMRGLLTADGILLANGGGQRSGHWIGPLWPFAKAAVWSRMGHQPACLFSLRPNREDLAVLMALVESGSVTPVLDRTYALSEAGEALGHVGEGHARGKVTLAI